MKNLGVLNLFECPSVFLGPPVLGEHCSVLINTEAVMGEFKLGMSEFFSAYLSYF